MTYDEIKVLSIIILPIVALIVWLVRIEGKQKFSLTELKRMNTEIKDNEHKVETAVTGIDNKLTGINYDLGKLDGVPQSITDLLVNVGKLLDRDERAGKK